MNANRDALTRRQAFRRLGGLLVVPFVPIATPKSSPTEDAPELVGPFAPDGPNHAAALAALDAADAALSALSCSHCGDYPRCDVCRDAEAARYVMGHAAALLAGELHGQRAAARAPTPADFEAAQEAGVLALYDALDALLDLSAFHCGGRDCCHVCEEADAVLYFVRTAIDLMGCSLVWTEAVGRRSLLSAERKADRGRRAEALGGGWMPNAAVEQADPARQVWAAAQLFNVICHVKAGKTRP